MEELSKPKNFRENLNFKMSNMNMNIKFQYLKSNQKFRSSYWVDKKKLDNYMLPTFTKKLLNIQREIDEKSCNYWSWNFRLFIANLFKRNSNFQITIFEKSNSINLEEGYGIQLSVNSIKLLNLIKFKSFFNNKKFHPSKIHFYSNGSSDRICELNISDFNSEDCKYTTLKRSDLINFLKKDLEDLIKTNHSISKIVQENQKIQLNFENNENFECDYLIISDGVFSKSKNLISNYQTQPKYNNTLAIRGMISNSSQIIDKKNILLFLSFNFHQVIYPVTPNGDLNFIAIMKILILKIVSTLL